MPLKLKLNRKYYKFQIKSNLFSIGNQSSSLAMQIELLDHICIGMRYQVFYKNSRDTYKLIQTHFDYEKINICLNGSRQSKIVQLSNSPRRGIKRDL